MKATIARHEIAVQSHTILPDREALTISCPEGWDDVKPLTRKVLIFQGKRFTYRGWNSDRNVAFFAAPRGGDAPFATVS